MPTQWPKSILVPNSSNSFEHSHNEKIHAVHKPCPIQSTRYQWPKQEKKKIVTYLHKKRVKYWMSSFKLFAFVSKGTFLAVDAEATSLLESLETSLAGVRTARKRLRLEIGKFSAIEEATIDQRYKEEVYSGKCVHNRIERVGLGVCGLTCYSSKEICLRTT